MDSSPSRSQFGPLAGLGLGHLIGLLLIAANLFNTAGRTDVGSIEAAHAGLGQYVGGGGALAFAVALLASGLSSSSVGTYAGRSSCRASSSAAFRCFCAAA